MLVFPYSNSEFFEIRKEFNRYFSMSVDGHYLSLTALVLMDCKLLPLLLRKITRFESSRCGSTGWNNVTIFHVSGHTIKLYLR